MSTARKDTPTSAPASSGFSSSLKDILSKDNKEEKPVTNPKKDATTSEEDATTPEDNEGGKFDRDEDYDRDKTNDPFIADNVTALRTDKTPAELAMESPDETAKRYGISTEISDEDADNPRVQVYRDTLVNQVPSGTHLHPDVAKDLQNRGIAEQHTDNAQVKRQITDTYDFAPDAETQDKY